MQVRERIRLLDDETIAQIAAGEIIERPVSVVKELVENSVDAGASSVRVDLRQGGRAFISVHDDGCGIPSDQLPLALQRHGTSKLASAQDLFAIKTLGFRGEGLASIAAAARSLQIVSRTAEQDFGACVQASAHALSDIARAAASPGTTVVVHDLFAFTPVRRQFLKSEKAELARISAFLGQFALGWPHVSFSLHHDGREVWNLPAVRHAAERIEMTFGKGSRGSLLPIEYPVDPITRISGFTAKPGEDRPNRHGQILFVNARLVRGAQLNAAWSAGYRSMLMTGRYPYGVLMLNLPAEEVDVNVHPTKLEVRFLNPAGVFEAVRRAVEQTLHNSNLARDSADGSLRSQRDGSIEAGAFPALPELGPAALSLLENPLVDSETSVHKARALGQIDQTYILLADDEALLVLDQHAAHERVAYEALLRSDVLETLAEPLLFPSLVELSGPQAATLAEYQEQIDAAGIQVEAFGETTYRITALPATFGRRHLDLAGLLDDLAQPESATAPDDRRRRILATIACHSVVRAHEPLSLQEQVALYISLRRCQTPHTCPHGRPTTLQISAERLAKAFNRV